MTDFSEPENSVSAEQAAEAERFKEAANVYFKSMLISLLYINLF